MVGVRGVDRRMGAVIPRRLIRCVPETTTELVEGWWAKWRKLHPGWEHVTIRDPIDPARFPLTGHLFSSCVHGAQVAGLVRLEAVHSTGGVYVDSDVEPLRPIDDLLHHPCFIGTEDGTHLTDAMFGAEREHPGIGECLRRVVTMPMTDGPQATGPLNTTACLSGRDDVTVLAARMLYPYSYLERGRASPDWAAEFPDSYAVHHWAFSWNGH